jgi:hypothetical protein
MLLQRIVKHAPVISVGCFVTLVPFVTAFADTTENAARSELPKTVKEALELPGLWESAPASKCFPSRWSGGTKGGFALEVESEFCLSSTLGQQIPIQEMNTQVKGKSSANGELMGRPVSFVRVQGSAVAPVSGTPRAEAAVMVLGYEVWSDSIEAPEIRWDRNFTMLNFDESVSLPFNIGPIPATVGAGVRANLDANITAALAIANARASFAPEIKSSGYAQVAVDVRVAKGGVEAELEFLNDALRIEGAAGLGLDTTAFPPTVVYVAEAKGHNDMSALNGHINVFAEFLNGGNRFERELFSWPGYEQSKVLFSQSIRPTPVFRHFPEIN